MLTITGYLNDYTAIETDGLVLAGRGIRLVRDNTYIVTDAAKAKLRKSFTIRLHSNMEDF